jgi:hypothetical protein
MRLDPRLPHSGTDFSMFLDDRKGVFDGVEVWRVGRKVFKTTTVTFNHLFDVLQSVISEVKPHTECIVALSIIIIEYLSG